METASTASDRPSVSVIVPCFNVANSVERLVAALLRQDDPAELFFVDDGSTDGTADRLRTLTAEIPVAHVLVHDRNRGRAAARNTGIAAATYDVLLFLDADMEPEPGFVRAHAEEHTRPDVVGIVSTPVLEGLSPDDLYHQYLTTWRGAVGVGTGQPLPPRYFIIGYTSVKAEALEAVGGFDERFSYGEDIDFAYRLARQYPNGLYRSDRAVVHHYNHGTLDDRLAKLRLFGRDNVPLLLRKHSGIAEVMKLDFLGPTTSWRGAWKRWALRRAPVRLLRQIAPRIPRPLRFVALRYLMASTIADAYREAHSPAP